MVIKSKVKHKKTPHHRKEEHTQENSLHNLAIGATAFCLIGAAAAAGILVARKRRSSKWEDAYDSLTTAADEYAHGAYEKGHDVYENARDTIDNIRNAASQLFNKDEKSHTSRNVILGVLGASLLGATAAYYANQNKNIDYEGFAKRNLNKWGDIGKSVIDTVTDTLSPAHEKNGEHNPVKNIIDVATFGINLWQDLKNRR